MGTPTILSCSESGWIGHDAVLPTSLLLPAGHGPEIVPGWGELPAQSHASSWVMPCHPMLGTPGNAQVEYAVLLNKNIKTCNVCLQLLIYQPIQMDPMLQFRRSCTLRSRHDEGQLWGQGDHHSSPWRLCGHRASLGSYSVL